MKKNSKAKRKEAEIAAENYCYDIHGCVNVVRSMVTQWQRQDLFGCDSVGKRADGSMVFVQVTAGQSQAVSERRKKLEKYPWHPDDTVELIQLVQTPNPANARQTLWFFRVHEYKRIPCAKPPFNENYRREWHTLEEAVPVPREWFKKRRKDEASVSS